MKKNEKAEKEIMDEKISDAEAQTDEAVKTKADYIAELEKAAVMGKISYADIGRILESVELDKDEMEEIYEELTGKGIEIVSEENPEDYG